MVTVTHRGYIKRLPVDAYRAQRRGGRGITALPSKSDDFVEQLFVASTHSTVLFFSKSYRLLTNAYIPHERFSARALSVPQETGDK